MAKATSVETVSPSFLQVNSPVRKGPTTAKFVAYQDKGHELFGPNPELRMMLEEQHPIFHEAGVFWPGTSEDSLFVTSSVFLPDNATTRTVEISKLTRKSGQDKWQRQQIPGCHWIMGNGGVNYPATGSVLFCAQGATGEVSSLVTMSTEAPFTTQKLLTNFHGRNFNSINDVVVAKDGAIWFTDPDYGFQLNYRTAPELPCQVYRFDPATNDVRAVADGFEKPNGLCFSPDERTMYVTDTAYLISLGKVDDRRASHIYAFSVENFHGAPFLVNKRLFAMADTGIPDGIKCDTFGNVYSGTWDGVSIWAPNGVLVGKIVVPGGCANFCFGRPGELFLLNERRFWVATISSNVRGALLEGMGIRVD